MPHSVTVRLMELLCRPEGISVIQMSPHWESWPKGIDPKVIDGSLPSSMGKEKRGQGYRETLERPRISHRHPREMSMWLKMLRNLPRILDILSNFPEGQVS